MRFTGLEQDGIAHVALVRGDRAMPIAPVADFYADLPRWTGAARTASDGGVPLAEAKLVPAIWPGARVLCVGLNYRAHAAEGGVEPPAFPAVFGRWTRSLIADGGTVPAIDPKLDWECELGVVIGRELAGVDEATALAGVFGYAAFNDISARTYQRHTHQWTPGKNMDRSGPIGSIVTADEVGDPARGLRIESRLNGVTMQSATTADMIFPVGRIISYLSEIMTLYPGDLIATGTPEGVGYARTPPVFMKPGDEIEIEIERVGRVTSHIVAADRRGA